MRAALAIDPAHDAAFERLRALLTELDDAPALAAALAARIEVAVNPFEVTSLRLTRADLLAGTLGDWGAAREELEAVLRRQPEHARALERLSELLWSREAWGEAGEIYLRRAVVERDPARLRGIFLRLGEIYSSRVPDPKRAAAAYERVLGVDPDNLEALRALSDLTVADGDVKRALPVTERLVAREPDAARRHRTRIRLGELLMQTGDLRRAAVELRRVVDESPRDLAAVGALAQLLDRARDQAGRRTVLDRAVRLHRQDLGRAAGGVQLETLRSLATLQTMRERPHAALAAAQLVAAVGGGTKEGVRAASRPGRSLAALRRPELDDRIFSSDALPPGIRQLLRQLGPLLRPSGQELAQRLGSQGVTKADRRTRGTPPRPLFDAVAAELGVGDFDLYVSGLRAGRADPAPRRAGEPAGHHHRRASSRSSARARCASRRLARCGWHRRTWTPSWRARPRRPARCWSGSSDSSSPTTNTRSAGEPDRDGDGPRRTGDPAQAQAAGDAVRGRERGRVRPRCPPRGDARRGQRGRPAGGGRSSGRAVGDPGRLRDRPGAQPGGAGARGSRSRRSPPTPRRWPCCSSPSPTSSMSWRASWSRSAPA